MTNNFFSHSVAGRRRKGFGRYANALQKLASSGIRKPARAYIEIFLLTMGVAGYTPIQAEPPKLPISQATHLLDITGPGDVPLFFPSDVVVDKHQVCVVDSGNFRISCFRPDGKLIRTIGRKGSAPGELMNPVGIGIDAEGRLYVADSGNFRVQIFTADGRLDRIIPIELDGQPIRPIDVLPDGGGKNIYVSTNTRHQIMVYDAEGHRERFFGGGGTSYGEFRYPATMAFTSDGRIAIVDVLNARLQVLMTDGEFSVQVGEWGVSPGQLFRPKGVAIDTRDNFYISDSYVGLVSAFSDEGKFRGVLGSDGGPSRLETPVGMAIDSQNRLYVAEMRANRVSVYKLEDAE